MAVVAMVVGGVAAKDAVASQAEEGEVTVAEAKVAVREVERAAEEKAVGLEVERVGCDGAHNLCSRSQARNAPPLHRAHHLRTDHRP